MAKPVTADEMAVIVERCERLGRAPAFAKVKRMTPEQKAEYKAALACNPEIAALQRQLKSVGPAQPWKTKAAPVSASPSRGDDGVDGLVNSVGIVGGVVGMAVLPGFLGAAAAAVALGAVGAAIGGAAEGGNRKQRYYGRSEV
jgi:hypothetical protein